MASTLLSSGEQVKGFLGTNINVPVYIQFVPGIVVEVCVSTGDLRTGTNIENINTIIAKPHYSNETIRTGLMLDDDYRYKPLLRGITEIPAKGDPVLLCTFGGINYYLGPLNTQNSVNWNEDNLWEPEPMMHQNIDNNQSVNELLKQQSINFSKTNHSRMSKFPNEKLDHPFGDSEDRSKFENHGDIMIEGRHGNSIRVGSRFIHPYIILSNSRSEGNRTESIGDGSLISITEVGSLNDHFGGYNIGELDATSGLLETKLIPNFILASDSITDNDRKISNLVKSTNQSDNVNPIIYDYDSDQILFHSNRITLNTKLDDIYISSIKDIHIGTGRNLTISTNKNLFIESQNIYLGNPIIGEESRDVQPLVLGNILKEILFEILDTFTQVKAISQAGALPLVDSTNTPLAASPDLIKPIKDKIETILSQYHFIEPNDRTE